MTNLAIVLKWVNDFAGIYVSALPLYLPNILQKYANATLCLFVFSFVEYFFRSNIQRKMKLNFDLNALKRGDFR